MILTSTKTAETYLANGMWGRVTLDTVFRRNTLTHPDRTAVIETSAGGGLRNLGYAEVDRRIGLVSGFLSSVGLNQDSVIALQMPVGADAVIALLGALRAGLIVAILPELWRRHELGKALSPLAPKVLVTTTRGGDGAAAERMRDIAADLFSVRFVCAFGEEVPDGVVPLDALDDESLAEDPARTATMIRKGNPADHVATLSLVETENGPGLLARSHNHWIAAGMMHLIAARIDQGARLISPYQPLGLVGMSAALVPWLLTGGTLVLHRFSHLAEFVSAATIHGAGRMLLPAGLATATHRLLGDDKGRTTPATPAFSLIEAGDESHALQQEPPARPGTVRIHRIGDFAAIPQAVAEGEDGALALGKWPPVNDDTGAWFLETRLSAFNRQGEAGPDRKSFTVGELRLRGPSIPDAAFPASGKDGFPCWDDEAFLRTGISGRLHAIDRARIVVGAPIGDMMSISGTSIAIAEIETLCASHEAIADAAILPLSDPVLGSRLRLVMVPRSGKRPTLEDIAAFLRARNVAPHKIPVEMRIVAELPRDERGRIARKALLDRIAA